jgi:nucleoid-associated protein YgaU
LDGVDDAPTLGTIEIPPSLREGESADGSSEPAVSERNAIAISEEHFDSALQPTAPGGDAPENAEFLLRPLRRGEEDSAECSQPVAVPAVDTDAAPAASPAGSTGKSDAAEKFGFVPPSTASDGDVVFLNDDALWVEVMEVASIPEDLTDESAPDDTAAAPSVGFDPATADDSPTEVPTEQPDPTADRSPIWEDEPDLDEPFADESEMTEALPETGFRGGRRRQWLLAVLLLAVLLAAVAWQGNWISVSGWRQWLPFTAGRGAETLPPPALSRPVPARMPTPKSESRNLSGAELPAALPPPASNPMPAMPSGLIPGHITIVDKDGKVIVYKVKRGDTLWGISKRYTGSGFNYPDMAKDNEIDNPDLIFPKQKIRVK